MVSVPLSGTKNRTVGRMGNLKFKTMYWIEPKNCHSLLHVEGSSEAYKILFHQLEGEKPDNLDKKSVEHYKYEYLHYFFLIIQNNISDGTIYNQLRHLQKQLMDSILYIFRNAVEKISFSGVAFGFPNHFHSASSWTFGKLMAGSQKTLLKQIREFYISWGKYNYEWTIVTTTQFDSDNSIKWF